VTGAVLTVGGLLLGWTWQESLAAGLILALSSTAIVVQTLREKGLMKTQGGQSSFAILLFQDIAVIPMLAALPLLASHHGEASHHGGDGHGSAATWLSDFPAPVQTLIVVGAIAAIVLLGRFVMRPAFRYIARARLREIFVAAALLLVIGIALLMTLVGLSPALGTFVAGVVLANSEYSHELEADIDPFKALLLGLFFISVGASIDFQLVASEPQQVAAILAGLIGLKFAVLFGLSRLFRLGVDTSMLVAFSLSQAGEFGFVLFSFAKSNGILADTQASLLTAAVALSMAVSPVLMLVFENFVRPRVGTKEREGAKYDEMEGGNRVIIAGYGRFGQIVGRLLSSDGIDATVLEIDPDQVELLRKFGRQVYYGDASRYDLLESAGAGEAEVLILALDDWEKSRELVHTAKKHFPHLRVYARARGRIDAYEKIQDGLEHVYRETFESALRMGRDVLIGLGTRSHYAQRLVQRFRREDERLMRELASQTEDADFVNLVRRRTEEAQRILDQDMSRGKPPRDLAWDAEHRRHHPGIEEGEADSVVAATAPQE
ncbi:MAG: cation:proton antiporter, partial [Myxococcota bacterium]